MVKIFEPIIYALLPKTQRGIPRSSQLEPGAQRIKCAVAMVMTEACLSFKAEDFAGHTAMICFILMKHMFTVGPSSIYIDWARMHT